MAPQGQCILDYGPQSGTPSLGLQCPGGKRPWEGQGLGNADDTTLMAESEEELKKPVDESERGE